jgi:hypothetical protein
MDDKYYIEKRLYFVNITKIIDIIKHIDNNNITKEYLLSIYITDLKEINQYIKENIDLDKKDISKLDFEIIDEYIFAIFINLYIINDLYNYAIYKKKLTESLTEISFSSFEENMFNNDVIKKEYYDILIEYIGKSNDELKDFIKTEYRDLKDLWTIYIKKIITQFNKSIYISNDSEYLTIDNHISNRDYIINFENIQEEINIHDNFSNYISTESIDDFIDIINNKIFNIARILQNNIIKYIKYIIKKTEINDDDIIKYTKNKPITIPQYHKNCWFLSIINALTHSDNHIKLLLEKQHYISSSSSSDKFIKLIFQIITLITNSINSSYDIKNNEMIFDNIDKELLKLIVKSTMEPAIIITDVIRVYNSYNIKNLIRKILLELDLDKNLRSYIYFNYFIKCIFTFIKLYEISQKQKYKSEENHEDKVIKSLNDLITKNLKNLQYTGLVKGISITAYNSVLKYFYNKLGLNITYLYVNISDDKISEIYSIPEQFLSPVLLSKLDDTIEFEASPKLPVAEDILILFRYNDIDDNVKKDIILNKHSNSDSDIEKLKNNNIRYRKEEYVLDYVILNSDDNVNCSTCGHAISGFKYKGNKYIYNSSIPLKVINQYDKQLRLNCSLINYKWNEDITKNNNDECFYNYLCSVNLREGYSNDILYLKYFMYSTRNCFNGKETVYVYIKKSIVDSLNSTDASAARAGGNGKYTNKKVKIIYNNKKYVRTIHIKNNKQYIHINNEYIELKQFKYSKKYDYYVYI